MLRISAVYASGLLDQHQHTWYSVAANQKAGMSVSPFNV